MRFIDRFFAMIDSHIDAAVVRVLARDKHMLAEQVAESYRHMIDPAAIASGMNPATIASHIDCAYVADSLDADDLADRLADKVDIDTGEIARMVGRNLDVDDVVSSVVAHIADDIDMSQVCDRCAEKIEVDEDEVIRLAADAIADNIDYDRLAKALLAVFAAKCA